MRNALTERLADAGRAFRAVLSNPSLRRLELSWAASVTGTWAYTVSLAVFAYERGGAGDVGLMGLIRVLPAAIAAPFAAGLGDRFRREHVLVVAGVLRVIAIGAASLLVFSDAPALLVYGLAGAEALVATVFRPLQTAMLPSLARSPDELTAANLVLTTIESVGMFVGPALGGVLLAVTGPAAAFAVTAALFAVAVVLLSGIRTPERPADAHPLGGTVKEALAGFRAIAVDRRLRLLVGLYGAQTLVDGALTVLIVVSALELLELGESGVGFLNSAVGVGGVVGGLVALVLIGRERLASDFGYGLILWGIPITLIGVFPEPPAALVLMVLLGIGVTLVDVAAVTLLQRVVPDEVLARVFGVLQSVFVATVGLGAIVAPILVDVLGARGALIVTGAFLPTLAALFWRQLSALNAEGVVPRRELELLQGVPLLRPLPGPLIEQLASSVARVPVAAGETVFREGESGDRFYVVSSGELTVAVDGKTVNRVGPGGWFGEIALLRDVPRTGTVTAASDCELLALDRDEFIASVTGHPASIEVADAVIATRLGLVRPGVASI